MDELNYKKLLRWCTYRDRCLFETLLKCKELGFDAEQTGTIISHLEEENYLNEQRFACQFVHSKSAVKKWGRQKILAALKRKKIKPEIIQYALAGLTDENYSQTLIKLAEKKWNSLKEPHPGKKKLKLRAYMHQKGYAPQEIQQVINLLDNK